MSLLFRLLTSVLRTSCSWVFPGFQKPISSDWAAVPYWDQRSGGTSRCISRAGSLHWYGPTWARAAGCSGAVDRRFQACPCCASFSNKRDAWLTQAWILNRGILRKSSTGNYPTVYIHVSTARLTQSKGTIVRTSQQKKWDWPHANQVLPDRQCGW